MPRPASPVARTINRCSSSLPGARQHACVVTMRRRRVPPLAAVPSEMERNRGVNDPGQARAWCPRARLRVVHASVPRLVAEADHCAAEVAENALCGGTNSFAYASRIAGRFAATARRSGNVILAAALGASRVRSLRSPLHRVYVAPLTRPARCRRLAFAGATL